NNLYSDCRHITAAQKNLESLPELPGLDVDFSPEQAAAAIAQTCSTATVFKRCISHLPIRAPAWCHLPSDAVIRNPPFKSGCNLPALFLLDDSAQCSCGYSISTYDHEHIVEDAFIVYTSTSALEYTARYRRFTVTHALI